MFCPNCGKDCGETKFCSECGMRVCLAASKDAVRKGHCVFPEPPITLKKVRWGTLEFTCDSMRVRIRLPRRPLTDILILYDEIFDVSYVPATTWRNGFLSVREWKDRHVPIPKRFSEMTLRNTTTWLEKKDNHDFYYIHKFLKQCAAINTAQKQK
jgi:hypothetical protein